MTKLIFNTFIKSLLFISTSQRSIQSTICCHCLIFKKVHAKNTHQHRTPLFFLHLSPPQHSLSADQRHIQSLKANLCITSHLHPLAAFISSLPAGLSLELQQCCWSTTITLCLYWYENTSG